MDPDMVRQQEEEEAASRVRRPPQMAAPTPPGVAPIPSAHARSSPTPSAHAHMRDAPFVLRADPREDLIAPPPLAPIRPVGWGVIVNAGALGLVATSLTLVAGIMLGVKLGLLPWQSLAIGAGAGFLLGWQSAAAALRRHDVPFSRALRATIVPTALIIIAIVGAMAAAALFHDISPTNLSDRILPAYWINVGVGALIGLCLAVLRMRRNLSR